MKSEDIGLIFAEASREKTFVGCVNVESLQMEEQGNDLIQSISCDKIICAQKNDDVIATVYNAVLTGKPGWTEMAKEKKRARQLLLRQFKKLTLENNVLVLKTAVSTQIVLPKLYHNLVFEELHNKMGHLGSEKVVELTRKRFYWPYMQKDIEFYIRKQC